MAAPVDRRSRLLRNLAVAGGGVVFAIVAVAAYRSMQVQEAPAGRVHSTAASASGGCSPPPCAQVQGYSVWVSEVAVSQGGVVMQVSFKNESPATHAEPADLKLIDSAGHSHGPTFDTASCQRWPRTDIHDGARLGPVPICFRLDISQPPLTLRWSPDLGLFCCSTDIKIA